MTDGKNNLKVIVGLIIIIAAAASIFLWTRGSVENVADENQNNVRTSSINQETVKAPDIGSAGKTPADESSALEKNGETMPGAEGTDGSNVAGRSGGAADNSKKTSQTNPPDPNFHIGVVTGTKLQGSDGYLGGEALVKLYGDVKDGGRINHVTYPDNFWSDLEGTMAGIEALAEDPRIKLIYVLEGIPGTADAFQNIRKKRPDILLFVSESHEDSDYISKAADLVVNADFISRGYLIPHTARELGAKTIVHVSFPRHMIDESLNRRRAIMELASKDLGLTFAYENAPDPTGDEGIEGAQKYIFDNIPIWLEKYGPDTAFFTTNNAHTEPMIKQVISHGGYFIEADESSPIMGYPQALEIDLSLYDGDWKTLIKDIEENLIQKNASGRLGTWTAPLGTSHALALVDYGIAVIEEKAYLLDMDALLQSYSKVSKDVHWNGALYTDTNLNQLPNVFLIYEDTYIFGRGYMGTTDITVPIKYKAVNLSDGILEEPDPFHIAVITGDEAQGTEELAGAREMVKKYGDAESGGLIHHIMYPNDYVDNPEATADLLESLISDPMLKVIVINQAVLGTAEGFKRVKAKRPDIICLSGEPHDNPDEISNEADLVVAGDFISRGYLIPYIAKEIGADTLVHISFDRHRSYDSMALRLLIMEAASKDLGLQFYSVDAPDPVGETGLKYAKEFVFNEVPKWLEKYGNKTVFFTTNDAHTEPLIKQVAKYGGYIVEADIPSPLMGYPEAFGLDLESYFGKWKQILDILEKKVEEEGASGRLGVWVYPLNFTQTAGLVEFGRLLAEGKTTPTDYYTLLQCLGIFTPGARWNGSFLNDPVSGKPLRNFFLIYQDNYMLGRGYIETTKVEIPDEYYLIKLNK